MNKPNLISEIKHDINNNLALILEANLMLQESSAGPSSRVELHSAILASARKLQNSINHLMKACDLQENIEINFNDYKIRRLSEKS